MALTIGVDVGGTTVAAGVVDEQGSVLATAERDTPSDDPRRRPPSGSPAETSAALRHASTCRPAPKINYLGRTGIGTCRPPHRRGRIASLRVHQPAV